MDCTTVAHCESQAEAELALARDACCAADRRRHLNRAAVFAHCSEEGRREAEGGGVADVGAHCCVPLF